MNAQDELNHEITQILNKYQSEYVSGRWYIEQTGLNKIAKLLGGEYKKLTDFQKKRFRQDAINCCQVGTPMKTWMQYLEMSSL